jgi:hypothetical protein
MFIFKKKITIVQNFVVRKIAKGTYVYKSPLTPSWSSVHMVQVCSFILVMKVNKYLKKLRMNYITIGPVPKVDT